MSNKPPSADYAPPSIRRLVVSCLVLTGALLLALPVYAWVGWIHHASAGVWSAAAACGTCLVGALGALLATGMARNGPQAVNAVLLGMLFRLGIPLGMGLFLQEQGGALSEAGIFGMILAYYLLALVVETLLSLGLVGRFKAASGDASTSRAL